MHLSRTAVTGHQTRQRELESHLEVKSVPHVIAAYFISPVIALSIFWLSLLVLLPIFQSASYTFDDVFREADSWLLEVLIVGLPFAFVAELVVTTPLLVGLQRNHWRWVNSWTLVGLGFVAAAVPWSLFFTFASPGHFDLAWIWSSKLFGSPLVAWFGCVGAISAGLIRVLALRSVTDLDQLGAVAAGYDAA
jgi:hypothetical protein